jgi:hypothetical protein
MYIYIAFESVSFTRAGFTSSVRNSLFGLVSWPPYESLNVNKCVHTCCCSTVLQRESKVGWDAALPFMGVTTGRWTVPLHEVVPSIAKRQVERVVGTVCTVDYYRNQHFLKTASKSFFFPRFLNVTKNNCVCSQMTVPDLFLIRSSPE